MQQRTIAILPKLKEAELRRIREAAPGWNIVVGPEATNDAVRDAEIVVGWRDGLEDVVLDATLPGQEHIRARIVELRDDLVAEHLGVEPAEVSRTIAETGSLIQAIEQLRSGGRSLHIYEPPPLTTAGAFLAEKQLLDPEGPDSTFEPLTRRRNLFRRLRRPPPRDV